MARRGDRDSIALIKFDGREHPGAAFARLNGSCSAWKADQYARTKVVLGGSFYCNPKGNVNGPTIAHEETVVVEIYDGPHYR